LQKKYILR